MYNHIVSFPFLSNTHKYHQELREQVRAAAEIRRRSDGLAVKESDAKLSVRLMLSISTHILFSLTENMNNMHIQIYYA